MSQELMNTLQQAFEQNVIDIENYKKEGRKAVGCYCLYSPVELIVAADAIPVELRRSGSGCASRSGTRARPARTRS